MMQYRRFRIIMAVFTDSVVPAVIHSHVLSVTLYFGNAVHAADVRISCIWVIVWEVSHRVSRRG